MDQRNVMTEKELQTKKTQLEARMAWYANEDVCLAFSGGADSSLLLKTAVGAAAFTGRKVYAVTFDSRLHPSCDLENARLVAEELGGIHVVIKVDELEQEGIRHNPLNRCYLCKKQLFTSLKQFACRQGIFVILDGTNEDDMHVYRPGIGALKELGIISPLADLHMTKAEIKQIAAQYGISAALRPSVPCLATRLPYGASLDYGVMERIGEGEAYIRTLTDGNVRLRLHGDIVRLELDEKAFLLVLKERAAVVKRLQELGFFYITLDLEGFRSGSMDIQVKNLNPLPRSGYVI